MPPAPAPTLDFDIGGAGQASAAAPDLTLDIGAAPKAADAGLDFDVTGGGQKKDISFEETVVRPARRQDAGDGFQPRPRLAGSARGARR
jgi:hypothetical protein